MDENIVLTAEQIKELGFETVGELTDALRKSVKSGAPAEEIEKLRADLQEVVKASTIEAISAYEKNRSEAEGEAFDALASEKALIDRFKTATTDEQKKIFDLASAEFGAHNAKVLFSDEKALVKMLQRPVAKDTPNKEDILAMQRAHDAALITTAYSGFVQKQGNNDALRMSGAEYMRRLQLLSDQGMDGAATLIKGVDEALDTATATEGAEWLPTILSNTLVDDLYLQLQVVGVFRRYTMPSKVYDLPIRTARSRGYRVAESLINTDFFTNKFTAHNLETSKVTFTAEKLGVLNFISDELVDDAILDMQSIIREDIVWGLADSIEDALLNGSTLLTDLDNATANDLWTSAADVRNAWDGVRKLTGASQKVAGTSLSLDVLRDCRKSMGKYGVYPSDLVWITSPEGYMELMKLDELVTIDKYGANATVVRGELARIDNIPIIVSENIYTNLNASGLYDGVTTDNTVILLVNRRGFAIGDRKMVTVETDRAIMSGQNVLVSHWRGDFQKLFPTAEPLAAWIHDVDV